MRRKRAPILMTALVFLLLAPGSSLASSGRQDMPQNGAPLYAISPGIRSSRDLPTSMTWYDAHWLYRKKIAIDHTKVAANLTNFPVLISLTSDSDLAGKAQDDGDDILFTQDDGVTKLDHEIEEFDGATGKLVAWVRIPSLSSSVDTEIYMYYGNPDCANQQNPTAVWDSSFKMVQHLKDKTASSIADSTANNNDGTKSAANNPQQVDGKIGKGQDFSEDYISCGDLGIGDSYTAECWMKADTLTGTGEQDTYGFTLMASSNSSGYYPLWLTVRQGEVRFWAYESSATGYRETSGANLSTGSYFYIVATATKNSTSEVYVDGQVRLSFTNDGEVDWTNIFTMGDLTPGGAIYFDGIIDEVRISNVVRSAGWIQTCYNNQSSPSGFYSVGNEERMLLLEGWGWCPLNYKGVGNATLLGALTLSSRAGEPGSNDIYLPATLTLVYADGSNVTLDLNLTGVKTPTGFYLTDPNTNDFLKNVAFRTALAGMWLIWDTGEEYIDCAGSVVQVMYPEVLERIEPCFLEVYSPGAENSSNKDLSTMGRTARDLTKFFTEFIRFWQTVINMFTGH